MKTFRLMLLSFLLVAITKTSGVAGEGTDVVYDGEGDPVKPNVPYYISFMTSDYNLWICRMKRGSSDPNSCPQQPLMVTNPNMSAPTQVMFVLLSKSDVVRESAKLKIKFVDPPHCGESGFWRVVQRTALEGEVVLNGSESTSNNDSTFAIHQTNEYYKFTFRDGDRDYQTTISLSNEYPIYRLLSKRMSGEMEIYFYKNLTTIS
ncbi:PREDICTED: kunitz-type elastase inhibitor BrEI-like [Camelina sativa]|uniref:Kunitz-type elastase inhibitor BrEI-like n=1 Tax=Camelina sativa TaxID=90675 RepID=A0ABM0SNI3_CAMSA|nr:PREDICTED: kunitz-type elastase inhibitor BrEI-like [Camelina sativa]